MVTLCDYTNVSVCDNDSHGCIYFSDGHYIMYCMEENHALWAYYEMIKYLDMHSTVTVVSLY